MANDYLVHLNGWDLETVIEALRYRAAQALFGDSGASELADDLERLKERQDAA